MKHIKIKRIKFDALNPSQCWIVLEDVFGNYIGTLHTQHKEFVKSMIDNGFTDCLFEITASTGSVEK